VKTGLHDRPRPESPTTPRRHRTLGDDILNQLTGRPPPFGARPRSERRGITMPEQGPTVVHHALIGLFAVDCSSERPVVGNSSWTYQRTS
jgi:hypothetical protein